MLDWITVCLHCSVPQEDNVSSSVPARRPHLPADGVQPLPGQDRLLVEQSQRVGANTMVNQHLLQLPGNLTTTVTITKEIRLDHHLVRVHISVIDIIENTEQTDQPVIRNLINVKSCLHVIKTLLGPGLGIKRIKITNFRAIKTDFVHNSTDFLVLIRTNRHK